MMRRPPRSTLFPYTPLFRSNPTPTGTDLSGFVAPENFVSHYGQPPAGVKVLDNTGALENCVHNAWGPRFGFAFQPLPNTNRVVLRGGYGIFYTRLHGNNQLYLITDMPFIGQFRVFGAAIRIRFSAASEYQSGCSARWVWDFLHAPARQ